MTGAPLILAIETSCSAGSTALLRGLEVLAERRFEPGMRGGNLLHPGVRDVLASAGGSSPDLVAVGIGPGSYTGARIGVVFAKTFAFARGLPLAGVSALEAIALRACPAGRAAVLMHASPGQVYAAVYECEPGSPPRVVVAPAFVSRAAFVVGLGPGTKVVEAPPDQSWAADVGRVAALRGPSDVVLDPDGLEPLYLQAPSPERVVS